MFVEKYLGGCRWGISLRLLTVLLLAFMLAPLSAVATSGNAENGKKIYMKRCWWCHGKTGEADGPAAEFLIPPPRDFSMGVYKYKTSQAKDMVVMDEDIFKRISLGMPGTGMPAWSDMLSETDRWDLVAFVKSLTDMFEEPPTKLDYSGKIKSSPESIEKGKKAFQEAKCFECHGQTGKGSLIKKLKEDSGKRVWPRNLTKPWTFRGGTAVEDIYSRVTNGIPNTPMPSFFAETTGKGKLSEEDRWNVANYVRSLFDESNHVKEGENVVKGIYREEMPKDEKDSAWDDAVPTAFRLVPQIIQKKRYFTPTNDSVQVKAFYNKEEVAFLLQWDDRTKSIPGDSDAEALAWDGLKPDAIAIQTPVKLEASAKPYFGHGDATHPVSMLYWNSTGATAMMTTKGSGTREDSDAKAAGLSSTASFDNGTWRVMFKRKLATPNLEKDTQFKAGEYMPMAFANWDGSNGEGGSKHTLTTWYWLLLMPDTGSSVVMIPGAVFLALALGQLAIAGYLGRENT